MELPIKHGQACAIVDRADLLASEAAIVSERHISWRARLVELGDYGTSGGSAADRRAIVEGMAALEDRSWRSTRDI